MVLQPPPNSGSYYFNYKYSFSIHLLALVDSDYKFLYVVVGCNGRVADGGVFRNSTVFAALEGNKLNVPQPKPIEENGQAIPYTIVADEAFSLNSYIIKNLLIKLDRQNKSEYLTTDCMSRARRVVENAFGILANRFRVLCLQ